VINLHWKIEEHFKVKIGGNIFIDIPNLIMYGDEPLFKIYRSTSDGLLGIDFDIYDKNGNKIATIRKGMIVQGDEKNYNISYREVVDHYKISEKKSGRIICDLKKREKAGDFELDLSVNLYTKSGFLFEATPTIIRVKQALLSGNTLVGCKYAIRIDPNNFSISIC